MASRVPPAVTRMVSPGEVLCRRELQGGENGLGDGFDVGEAAGAGHAAGEIAAAGLDDDHAAGFE